MNLKNKKYLCIIPARAGSQGIKNKNIKILDGIPLVEHTIKFSKKIEKNFDIVVSTNSKKVLSIAKKYNLSEIELRPEYLSGNNSLTIDVVKYELKRLEKKNKKKYEVILLLQPTVPYRRIKDIIIALKKIQSSSYDSVVSIKNVEGFHPLRMKVKKKKYIVNYSSEKKENMKPRQKLPKVFLRSGSIYMIKRKSMISLNSMVGKKVYGLEQSGKFTINIDTHFDLFLAKNKNKYL
tara:strand:+ start:4 stop:711 length:708 start_codon:yes stop_codon:yes gene_type:complete